MDRQFYCMICIFMVVILSGFTRESLLFACVIRAVEESRFLTACGRSE